MKGNIHRWHTPRNQDTKYDEHSALVPETRDLEIVIGLVLGLGPARGPPTFNITSITLPLVGERNLKKTNSAKTSAHLYPI